MAAIATAPSTAGRVIERDLTGRAGRTPGSECLALLPPGPDAVRRLPLRGARPGDNVPCPPWMPAARSSKDCSTTLRSSRRRASRCRRRSPRTGARGRARTRGSSGASSCPRRGSASSAMTSARSRSLRTRRRATSASRRSRRAWSASTSARSTSKARRSTMSQRTDTVRRSAAAASGFPPSLSSRRSSAAAASASSSSRRRQDSTMRTRPRRASTASSTCSQPRVRRRGGRASRCAGLVRARRALVPLERAERGRRGAAGCARDALPFDRQLLVLRAGRRAAGARAPVSGYGVFSHGDGTRRIGWRAGDEVVDLSGLGEVYAQPSLERADGARSGRVGRVARAGAHARRAARPARLCDACTCRSTSRTTSTSTRRSSMRRTWASSSVPNAEPLLPNWRFLPVGYHGRAGTVVVSGTDVRRPAGQVKEPDADAPVFGPSRRLDIELELGFVVGVPSALGTPVPVERFAEHVFGVVLVNDWSARDIQAWEYVPLGPFLGKSFQTSISAWVTPLALLEERRVEAPPQEPAPLAVSRGRARLGARHRSRGGAERRGDLARQRSHPLLDDAAAARPRHRRTARRFAPAISWPPARSRARSRARKDR